MSYEEANAKRFVAGEQMFRVNMRGSCTFFSTPEFMAIDDNDLTTLVIFFKGRELPIKIKFVSHESAMECFNSIRKSFMGTV